MPETYDLFTTHFVHLLHDHKKIKQPFFFLHIESHSSKLSCSRLESTSSYGPEIPVIDRVLVLFTSVEGIDRDRNKLPFESFLLYLSISLLITMLHCLQLSHINSTPKYLKWSEMLVPLTDLKQQEPRVILDSCKKFVWTKTWNIRRVVTILIC